jgi:hypothetical protein
MDLTKEGKDTSKRGQYTEDRAQMRVSVDRTYDRGRVQKQIEWLGELATMLRSLPGRKQVVFLSEGFDGSLVQGRETSEVKADNEKVIRGKIEEIDSDAVFGSAAGLTDLTRLEHAFRGSDVVLSAIDVKGIRGQSGQEGVAPQSNDGLFLLARPTGGVVVHNSNDLAGDFHRYLQRQEVVYILGFYAPPATKPGAFHPIKVKVTGATSRVSVAHRTGFYDAGGADFNERLLAASEIVMNDIPQNGVRVSTLAAAFPAAGGNARVPVIVDVDGAALLATAKDGRASAHLYVYAFGDDGNVRDHLYQPLSIDLAKLGDRLRAGGVRYYGTLSLPPGKYAIKTLVRGTDDRNGFTRTELTVPKDGEVTVLTPIPIDEAPKAVLVKAKPRDANEPYPFTVGTKSYVPCAIANGRVALYIVGASPEEIAVEGAQVVGKTTSGAGTTVVVQVDKPTEVTIKRNGTVLQTASIR